MKLRHEIDYKGLKDYLESLKYENIECMFQTEYKKGVSKLHEIDTRYDLDAFGYQPKAYGGIIEYGEPFLMDALGNDLSIVILSRRKYKLPNGKAIYAKFVKTIIEDCRKIYGTPLNGEWRIPNQFITPINRKS